MRAAIHPAIGVARVGNSHGRPLHRPRGDRARPGEARVLPGPRRGPEAAGRPVSASTATTPRARSSANSPPTGPTIRWTVHVANAKAAWYQWQMALDVPEAAAQRRSSRRNAEGDRAPTRRGRSVIDGGPRSRSGGRARRGPAYEFHGHVPGDRRLPRRAADGRGRAAPVPRRARGSRPRPAGATILDQCDPNGFINADGWYDDIVRRAGHGRGPHRRPLDPGRTGLGRHRPAGLRPRPRRRPDPLRPALRPLRPGGLAAVPRQRLVPRRRLPDPPPAHRPAVGQPRLRHPVRAGRPQRLREPALRGHARA